MATFRKRGAKHVAEVAVNGRRASKTFNTKREAQKWAVQKEIEFEAMASGKSTPYTLGEAFERYASQISTTKRGERWEIIRLDKISRDQIVKKKLAKLHRKDIEAWIERSKIAGLKSSSINRELNLISSCLAEARRWEWMSHNPMEDLRRPKNPPPRERRISPEEIRTICRSLNYSETQKVTQTQHRTAVAFLFAIETAMRAGEICSLDGELVDEEKRVATLPMTKNGASRKVPLSREAVRLWRRLPDRSFGLKSEVLSSTFRRAVRKAEIDDLTFHDSRHEATTRLADKLDVLELARTTGHKDINQLRTYYNKSAEDLALKL